MRCLPPFLVAEVRQAFQSCSRQYAASRRSEFSTLYPRLKASKAPKKNNNLPIQVIHSRLQAQQKEEEDARLEASSEGLGPDSKELVPQEEKEQSLDTKRKIPVPMKVIPKAEIAPGLTLSPKERLHIEQLTRKLPPRQEQKGNLDPFLISVQPTDLASIAYKKRIRIYTAGLGRIYMLTFVRFFAILGFTVVSVIVVPAHWVAGSSLFTIAGLWLIGAVPFISLSWLLRPIVTEVFLQLPTSAQASPKLAMSYAKSLPADAALDLRFMRNMTLTDTVSLKIGHTKPAKSYLRPVSFEWTGPMVNRGPFLRPNPTQFFVHPESSGGRAARDVTPGLWSKVYERLTGVESSAVAKWRR